MDGSPYILVNTAEGAKSILSYQEKFIKLPLSYENLVGPLLGKGLITSDLKTWKPHRKVLSPYFGTLKLSDRFSVMSATVAQALQKTSIKYSKSEATTFFKEVSLETNWKLLLGKQMADKKAQEWNLLLEEFNPVVLSNKLLGTMAPLITQFMLPNFFRIRDKLRMEFGNLIDGEALPESVVHEMIASEEFSRENIIDQCLTFLFAGHDSTANCICWTLYFLEKNSEVKKRLLQEIMEGRVDVNNLSKDTYLKACVFETLRRAPPLLLLDRLVTEKTVIEGIEIAENTPVTIGVYNIHHCSKYWEDPYSYSPERFVNPKHPPFAFLGFSAGERNCLGKNWAIIQVQLILFLLLTKYKYSLHTNKMQPTYAPFYQPSRMEIEILKESV